MKSWDPHSIVVPIAHLNSCSVLDHITPRLLIYGVSVPPLQNFSLHFDCAVLGRMTMRTAPLIVKTAKRSSLSYFRRLRASVTQISDGFETPCSTQTGVKLAWLGVSSRYGEHLQKIIGLYVHVLPDTNCRLNDSLDLSRPPSFVKSDIQCRSSSRPIVLASQPAAARDCARRGSQQCAFPRPRDGLVSFGSSAAISSLPRI
jgi:hypothetical protein